MKYLIVSDVHGSIEAMEIILSAFNKEKADKLIILGDVYNHGPRNLIPSGYSPKRLSEILNSIKDKIIVLKGNCDSEVDKTISEFEFLENLVIDFKNKSIFLSHGHVYNKNAIPKTNFNALVYGHFHTAFIEEENGVVFANPGSISIAKDDITAYLVLEDGVLTLKSINGVVLATKEIGE